MSRFVILTSVLLLITTQLVTAVTYTVTNAAANTPGGTRFNNEIGSAYARQSLSSATDFIWKTFQQSDPADRKTIQQVRLLVSEVLTSSVLLPNTCFVPIYLHYLFFYAV